MTKKQKKAYELNRHFKNSTWAIELLWARSVLGSNRKVAQVQCKVCTLIENKKKVFVPKLDFFWKHASHCKALVVMLGVKVGEHYFLKIMPMLLMKIFMLQRVLKKCCSKSFMVQLEFLIG